MRWGSAENDKNLATKAASIVGVFAIGVATFLGPTPLIAQEMQDSGVVAVKGYDGFADYAKDKQMEQSDVGCFMNECGEQTKNCFTDGSCLKGVTCLGRCKGEQECATRCFAQYGSPKLDAWLSCTLEDHACVKIPKDMDFSAIDKSPPPLVKGFTPPRLEGTWYKVLGLNPKYDMFDCQRNKFTVQPGGGEANLEVEFRLSRPPEAGGGFWENTLTEELQIDPPGSPRTLHTEGKMFGLTFRENWFVTGASAPGDAEEWVFVQYKGHTLQGSYDGGFVFSRTKELSPTARKGIEEAALARGVSPSSLLPIDNACPADGQLPTAGAAENMNIIDRIKYEAGFLYDLLEWVKPGTIHKFDE